MKLSRQEIKSMFKECLLELIQEGKLSINESVETESPIAKKTPKPQQQENPQIKSMIDNAVRTVTNGDSKKAALFEQIFADTAMNTLPKQLANDPEKIGGSMVHIEPTEEELAFDKAQISAFAASDRWAAVAFNKKI